MDYRVKSLNWELAKENTSKGRNGVVRSEALCRRARRGMKERRREKEEKAKCGVPEVSRHRYLPN